MEAPVVKQELTCAGEMPTKATLLLFFLREGVCRAASMLLGSTSVARCRFPIVPIPNLVPSSTASSGWCSDSSRASVEPLARMNTPTNVAAHPYKKVTISWKPALLKSPYKMALPVIADKVKNTNWIGITVWAAVYWGPKKWRLKLTYLTIKAH